MTLQQALTNSGLQVKVCADVRDGSLISQHEPNTGTAWVVEENSETRAGNYYQCVMYTLVSPSHPILDSLPDNCWIQ